MADSMLNDFVKNTELPWRPAYSQEGSASPDEVSPDSPEYWIVAATVFFTVTVYVLENYLNQRQLSAFEGTEFPKQLETMVEGIDAEAAAARATETTEEAKETEETKKKKKDMDETDRDAPLLPQLRTKFSKSQSYGLDRISFGMLTELYGLVEGVGFLLLGYLPYAWDLSVRAGRDYGVAEGEIGVSLIFVLLTTLCLRCRLRAVGNFPCPWLRTCDILSFPWFFPEAATRPNICTIVATLVELKL